VTRPALIAKYGGRKRRLPPPEYLLWEITLRCNLRCLHCAAGAGRARRGELSTAEALDLCDRIADLGVPSVALMGGEPLLRKDWRVIARRLRDRGIEVGLITNGLLFDEKAARDVLDLGICQVGVSLDGAAAGAHERIRGRPGSFERALRAVETVGALDIPYPTVLTSVNALNIGELPAMLRLLLSRPARWLWIVNFSSPHRTRGDDGGWALDEKGVLHLARFIHENRRRHAGRITIAGTHGLGYFSKRYTDLHETPWEGCLAGRKALGIRSDGRVVGCLILPDPFVEGSVRERPLEAIWNDGKAFAYARRPDRRKLRGKCRGCPHGALCAAGCTNVAWSFSGSIHEAPFCLFDIERRGGRASPATPKGGRDFSPATMLLPEKKRARGVKTPPTRPAGGVLDRRGRGT
jgi:radical SAM protein with 4Fe4S-binding SPASM domain